MLPLAVIAAIEALLARESGLKTAITASQSLAGGSINHALKMEYAGKPWFIKWNSNTMLKGMFETEARGLDLLTATTAIRTPKVIGSGAAGGIQYLLLSFVHTQRPTGQFWEDFGQELAALHQQTQAQYGLGHDNYIGLLPQCNAPLNEWHSFFRERRLKPLIEQAKDKQMLDRETLHLFDALFIHLPDMFPDEKPALLHGDLWSGNFLCDDQNRPVLIDPAVYYGHREMDLAMTLLFGGFDKRFYEAYHATFPLEQNWRERVDVCNLYPLLVHTLLFGDSYAHQLKSNLKYVLRFKQKM